MNKKQEHTKSTAQSLFYSSTTDYQMSKFFIFTLLLCFLTDPIFSIVQLSSISTSFPDTPARFSSYSRFSNFLVAIDFFILFQFESVTAAAGLNGSAICGGLWVAEPLDACSPLLDEVEDGRDENANIVLISDVSLRFIPLVVVFSFPTDPALQGQMHLSPFQAHSSFVPLGETVMGNHEGLWIYAVFVSNTAGETLRENARGVGGKCCIISLVDETAWTVLVISFISLLAVICLLVSICFTVNQWRNHQETRATAVDDNVVDTLPRITFGSVNLSAPIGETCTICLEDYKHGESLKILPCRHGFHLSCVDSWLTKCAAFCPVCKHDVRTRMTSSIK
ncbi:hypothetical protein SASPL_114126 [Salvia splendens]|uniref:RING-type domain-containing protein n=1 Tax=Salvia splendens TaxID=180675 RepID=A0A8X8Y5D8_SALSN|nr:hypothetical protein SASPL_114126 [Salvia splendens]